MSIIETAIQTEDGLVYFNGEETFTFTGKNERKATHIVTVNHEGQRLVFSCNGRLDLAQKAAAQGTRYGRKDARVLTVK